MTDSNPVHPATIYGLRGYAAVFGPPADSDGDIIEQGAFTRTLALSAQLPLFYGHANLIGPWAMPIGVATRIYQDDWGLYFTAQLATTSEAAEVMTNIELGSINGMSFTYDVVRSYERNGITYLTDLELYELSPVVYPANPATRVELYELTQPQETEPVSDSETDTDDILAALQSAVANISGGH